MLLGEVAPAAPAIPALIALALLIVAYGIVFVVRKLVSALFGWLESAVSWLPWVGGEFASLFQSAEQAVANALGTAENAIDSAIGSSWHLLARYMEWMWRELVGSAALLFHTATSIGTIAGALDVLRIGVRALERAWHGIEHGVRTVTRDFHGLERRVRSLEHALTSGIGHDLRVGLAATEKELARVENATIPAIQQAESEAQAAISNLYDWVKGKASLLGVGTFATAIAATIGIDAFNGLRCSQWGNLTRKFGCGLGSLLDGLLGLVISGLVLTNICDMLGLLETAYGDVAGPLISFLTEIPLGGCETPPSSWAQLNVAAGPLPPLQTLGTLPV